MWHVGTDRCGVLECGTSMVWGVGYAGVWYNVSCVMWVHLWYLIVAFIELGKLHPQCVRFPHCLFGIHGLHCFSVCVDDLCTKGELVLWECSHCGQR